MYDNEVVDQLKRHGQMKPHAEVIRRGDYAKALHERALVSVAKACVRATA